MKLCRFCYRVTMWCIVPVVVASAPVRVPNSTESTAQTLRGLPPSTQQENFQTFPSTNNKTNQYGRGASKNLLSSHHGSITERKYIYITIFSSVFYYMVNQTTMRTREHPP